MDILTLFQPFIDWLAYITRFINGSWDILLSGLLVPVFFGLTVYVFNKLKNRYVDGKTAKALVHFRYGYKDVEQKRALFISTQFQNESPTREEEPGFSFKFVAKQPLIPFFIKTAFDEKKDSKKFYLVLADSGMGKTTFMINLYLRYHSFWNFRSEYKMKLFPFGDKDVLESVKQIDKEEARNTILLLDAFDEYKALLPPEDPDGLTGDERFRKVLDEIIENVSGFREVVITSRAQYFPGQEDEPYELKVPRYGRAGFHTLAKLYLSPFEKKQIDRYLNKKYVWLKFWDLKKKRSAFSVVERSPRLMARPMLLSYIDYLVDENRRFENAYQIYETLIEKWLEREAEKRKHDSKDREKFKKDLYDFSRLAALEIHHKQKKESSISEEEAKKICDNNNNIDLRDYEITGQSLLTRDSSHNWKFAHKSILEYFLAKEALDDIDVWAGLAKSNFKGMEMTKRFYKEADGCFWIDEKVEGLYQAYEFIIEKWIELETEKIKPSLNKRKKVRSDLRAFARLMALEIYGNQKLYSALPKSFADKICDENTIDLSEYKSDGNSLIVKEASGDCSFSRQSIFEFLLATEAIQNSEFGDDFYTVGMETALLFIREKKPGLLMPKPFIYIKGGTFKMGDEHGDLDKDSLPIHEVTVSDYYIRKTPVTQKQWRDVMGGDPKSLHFKGRDDCPVENVSWDDAQEYIARLNDQTGKRFRLPTEAEWEYAARGGNKSNGYKFSGGDKLMGVGWYEGNSESKTNPVATRNTNELGLHDMSGNVWEWCQDRWHENYEDAPKDGSAWESGEGSNRVMRGGSWFLHERYCRVAHRYSSHPEFRSDGIGFRLVLVP